MRVLPVALGVALWAGLWAALVCAAEDQAMLQADRAFVEAAARADKPALEKLLDADFTWTDSEGRTLTKAQVLRDPPKSAITNERDAQLRQYTYGEIGDVRANIGRTHVLRVWVKRAGGWKAIVYQEVMSLDAPPSFAPGAGKDCENPCRTVAYTPKNEAEQQVLAAYSKLETAAMAHNSAVFATLVADEFVAASSNSNKLYDKRGRMEDFDHSKMAGVGSHAADVRPNVRFRGCGFDDVGAPARPRKAVARYSGVDKAGRKLGGNVELSNFRQVCRR